MSFTKTRSFEQPILRELLLVVGASFLISLSAKVLIPLWFTPVPIATQNSVVLLLALLLGPTRAAAATFLFLVQGAFGLPVFTTGGGLTSLLGPTGGYLIGYLIASYVTGALAERKRTAIQAFLAMMAGNLVIYLCGASYLATFVGFTKALTLGVAPFLLGDLVKTCVAVKIAR